jgi:hypothetical protein
MSPQDDVDFQTLFDGTAAERLPYCFTTWRGVEFRQEIGNNLSRPFGGAAPEAERLN